MRWLTRSRATTWTLADELGDLQLQVVFHSQMAEEAGQFTLDDVLGAICDKLERRHPHLFGGAESSPGWEALKAAERQKHPDESALAGVALALPALERAQKLQRRAARTGFDWPDIAKARPRAKIAGTGRSSTRTRNRLAKRARDLFASGTSHAS